MHYDEIVHLLGDQAEALLHHHCEHLPKEQFQLPNGHHVDQSFINSDRSIPVLRSLQTLYDHGRLGGTGYLSLFPVDQGIEHSAGFSFAHNSAYFNPETIVKVAIEGGASGVTSTLGVLGLVARKFAHKIPFILKLNHNELLTYPAKHDQIMFAQVEQAFELGAIGVGATIYFGSPESNRQIIEVSQAFARAHELGLFTMLWCYPRSDAFRTAQTDYESAADITGQANHLGVTIQADIIKQKLPNATRALEQLKHSKYSEEMYQLAGDHPIDWVRYQVANCYAGKISLINSGGEASADPSQSLADAVRTAVVNKRGGGTGLIMGRKIFKTSLEEGLKLMHAVQDVYLEERVEVA